MKKFYCDRCGKEIYDYVLPALHEVCGYEVCANCKLDYTRAINVVEDAWIRDVKNQEMRKDDDG